ncbi:MAG TPA: nickel pincer cofactor biosynthesis protein LarC [Lachnospiraceae bacterium]|nr:nickel pincer cofactor biosynthesis protein LarC [Lachnospiraceae bacterium]
MADIERIVSALAVSDRVKKDVMNVYRLIAGAESRAHGVDASEVHFHEVGMMDAIADITAVCLAFERLGADRIVASPVHVGSGQVRCQHGIMPVPAPATADILKGVPVYGGGIEGELCTPTGAALIRYFAEGFGDMPHMTLEKTGYGMGKKDFPRANCLRAMLGEETGALPEQDGHENSSSAGDIVTELSCNVDDMTGEETGFLYDRLFEAGAREVFTTAVVMKKSRPGLLLTVLCDEDKKDALIRAMFKYTQTIGIRESVCRRHILKRELKEVNTPFGRVRVKESTGYGVVRRKAEFDDVARIAEERGESISEIRRKLEL